MPKGVRFYTIYRKLAGTIALFEKPKTKNIRTFEVFKCPFCEALTNKASCSFVFKSRYQVEVFCPNSAKCWHHELEDKMQKLSPIMLLSEKLRLLGEIKKLLRLHKKSIKNDVVGRPGRSPVCDVTRTRQYRRGCKHRFPPLPGLKVM